ncbi:MAG: hypothetical protein A3H96_16550 [Acidobacteria bacterium RIFCSPLOWO2_02_FULL_67_36]|nr:MAG: hypothetical protein A3H96_16550 [Acidobacteria bacterium RIFCSPLOWO2_02_FULL_67_36]OFW20774.1 MAG: hypothetical protein A3G21_22750 [Acidobacteria bacterium RIFCSPLOWO2_12_FULL_66_21]
MQDALRNQPPAYLIVAIDGLCDETNAQYRKGARLQPALEGVRALADWKRRSGSRFPVLHGRFMAMRHNEHELPDVRAFAAAAGFDMLSIRALSIIDSSDDTHRALLPSDDALRAYTYENGARVSRQDFVCQHAFSYPTVLADGTLVACEQDYNGTQPYGRLSSADSFRDLWFSPRAARIRRIIRDDPPQFSFCRNCPYADRPTSSCSVAAYRLESDGRAARDAQ